MPKTLIRRFSLRPLVFLFQRIFLFNFIIIELIFTEVAAIKEAEFLYREVKNSLDMVLDQLIMLERNNLLDQIKACL
jgi:hypothetical protein